MNQLSLFPETTTGTVSAQSRPARMTSAALGRIARAARPDFHRGRGDSAALMLDALYRSPAPMTRRQLCHAIGREKQPALIALLEDMVMQGYVLRHDSASPARILMYVYEPNRAMPRPDWSVR